MKYIYHIRTDRYKDAAGDHITYGIDIWRLPDRDARLFRSHPGLFKRREQAENLILRCNAMELDPCHLPGLIEEALASQEEE